MNHERFAEITRRYAQLRIGVVGDFCLDRYLEIDPSRAEPSIETGLPVYNVVRVRSQPGAAGTILNNLVALAVGSIYAVGFCGEDGEGFELCHALGQQPGVKLDHFISTPLRRTFTYCKPLVMESGQPPRELNRLDSKNWTATPDELQREMAQRIEKLAEQVDVLILMDQVDIPQTGVVTRLVAEAAHAAVRKRPELLVLADSRRGLAEFPPLGFKMNAAELAKFSGNASTEVVEIRRQVTELARRHAQPVFVTLAERGMVGALGSQAAEHVPSHAVRGPIDIVGAGDSVTANLAAALAAGASASEAMQLAMAAASLVIHQLGTTGTANVREMAGLLGFAGG